MLNNKIIDLDALPVLLSIATNVGQQYSIAKPCIIEYYRMFNLYYYVVIWVILSGESIITGVFSKQTGEIVKHKKMPPNSV